MSLKASNGVHKKPWVYRWTVRTVFCFNPSRFFVVVIAYPWDCLMALTKKTIILPSEVKTPLFFIRTARRNRNLTVILNYTLYTKWFVHFFFFQYGWIRFSNYRNPAKSQPKYMSIKWVYIYSLLPSDFSTSNSIRHWFAITSEYHDAQGLFLLRLPGFSIINNRTNTFPR